MVVDEVHFLDVVYHVNCHNFVAITPPQKHSLAFKGAGKSCIILAHPAIVRISQVKPWIEEFGRGEDVVDFVDRLVGFVDFISVIYFIMGPVHIKELTYLFIFTELAISTTRTNRVM